MSTICALSTARFSAAIAIIRVSGQRAIEICQRITVLKKGKLGDLPAQSQRLAQIIGDGRMLDEAMVSVFYAPHSYTGEDMVELYCHGGLFVVQKVMEQLVREGCVVAERGEFTKRAFLNGKLDLAQAEAVCELIESRTEAGRELALRHMQGGLSDKLDKIYNTLTEVGAEIAAYCDFPDEGLGELDEQLVKNQLTGALNQLKKLEQSFDTGAVIRDGVDTAIIGAPNAGKSTLLNAVLGYERSIVSDIAGTTRDIVGESAVLGGVCLNLMDTAGIRKGADKLEQMGIKLSENAINRAGFILAVFDSSRKLTDDDHKVIELIGQKPAVALVNKSDLPKMIDFEYIKVKFKHIVEISAQTGKGLDRLEQTVKEIFLKQEIADTGEVVTSARQMQRISHAARALESAVEAMQAGYTADVIAIDVNDAMASLGELTGQTVSEQVIDEVFEKFCVGK